jgi:hypothetical protein
MPTYQNSKIYRVVCSETNKEYIGSTTQKLCYRLGQHKSKHNTCVTKTFINPKIFLIENSPCNSKEELRAIERKYIENTHCVNYHVPGRTPKEWREQNKELTSNLFKVWYEKNKEKQKEKIKCECGGFYTHRNYSHHIKAQSHINGINPNYIKPPKTTPEEKKTQYRKLEKIRNLEFIRCDICNKEVKKRNMSRHIKQKIHLSNLHV